MNKAMLVAVVLVLAGCTRGATPTPAADLPAGACQPPAVRSIIYASPETVASLADGGLRPILETPEWSVACLDEASRSAMASEVHIEVDPIMTALEEPNEPKQWGLQRIEAPLAWPKADGAGQQVAIIDSGVDCGHPDIGGCAWRLDNAGGGALHPHGTHVAGIVMARINGVGGAGAAPGASVGDCRALGTNGSGYTSNIAQCVTASADRGATVINMSLGGSSSSTALDNAIKAVIARGVVVVAAAGNSNTSSPSYPGCSPGVIGVAATDVGDGRASFSNHGPCVDVAAPGVDILSSVPGGAWQTMSGTSMAAPFVAGAAALALAVGNQPAAVQEALRATGDPVAANIGGRRINVGRLVGADPVPVPPTQPPTPGPAPVTPGPTAPPSPGQCVQTISPLVQSGAGFIVQPLTVVVPCAR